MPEVRQRPDLQKSLVGFVVGEVTYAVPIGSVREIVNPTGLTALPHAPASVAGVIYHRGEVVPVVDLRARFGLPKLIDMRRSKWILINIEGRIVGLAVDRVTDVFGTGRAEIMPPPALGPQDDRHGVVGVTKHDGILVFVLDVTRFDAVAEAVDSSALVANRVAHELLAPAKGRTP